MSPSTRRERIITFAGALRHELAVPNALRFGDSLSGGGGGSRNNVAKERVTPAGSPLRLSTLGTRSTGFRPGRICLRSSARIMGIYGNSFRPASPPGERQREREGGRILSSRGRECVLSLKNAKKTFHPERRDLTTFCDLADPIHAADVPPIVLGNSPPPPHGDRLADNGPFGSFRENPRGFARRDNGRQVSAKLRSPIKPPPSACRLWKGGGGDLYCALSWSLVVHKSICIDQRLPLAYFLEIRSIPSTRRFPRAGEAEIQRGGGGRGIVPCVITNLVQR